MNKEVVNVSLCFKLLGDVCTGPFRLDWIGPSSTSDLGFVKQIMDLPQIRCSYWRGNKDMLKKLDRNGSIGSYCKIYGSRFTPHPPLPLKALLYWHIALGVNFCKDFDSTFVHLYSRMFHSQSGTVFVSRKFTFPWNHITVPVENTTKLYYIFDTPSAEKFFLQDFSKFLRHHLFSAGPFKLWHFQYRSESEGRHSFSIFASYWFRPAYLGLDWFGDVLLHFQKL